jgi:uncharacterized membrane protein YtjA (UPF0391 family)
MWNWALTFLIIALIAFVLGFVGLAEASSGAAHILFYLSLTSFVGSRVTGLMRRA